MFKVENRQYTNAEGETITQRVLNGPATVKSINANTLKNTKGTDYRYAKLTYVLPNGEEKACDAILFEAVLELNPDAYAKGETVSIDVQLDGEYAGMSKVVLNSAEKFDISAFAAVSETVTEVE